MVHFYGGKLLTSERKNNETEVTELFTLAGRSHSIPVWFDCFDDPLFGILSHITSDIWILVTWKGHWEVCLVSVTSELTQGLKVCPCSSQWHNSQWLQEFPNSLSQSTNKPNRRSHRDTKLSKGHLKNTQGTSREIWLNYWGGEGERIVSSMQVPLNSKLYFKFYCRKGNVGIIPLKAFV